jgi:hypothetical protein
MGTQTKLKRCTDYYKKNPKILLGLVIAAAYPHNSYPSDADLLNAHAKLTGGTLKDQSATWFYYFADIPVSWISDIEMRDASGKYHSVFQVSG